MTVHAEVLPVVTQAQYFGWIPVLSGLLRFGDHFGVVRSDLVQSISHDSDLITPHSVGCTNERLINVAVWISHRDESRSIRKFQDSKLSKFLDSSQEALARDRTQIFIFKMGGVDKWTNFGQDEEANATWMVLPGSLYSFNPKTNAVDFCNTPFPDEQIVAAGSIKIRRSGFLQILITKVIGNQRPLEDWANQVYYALKHIFHRHKYHNSQADGLLKVYSFDTNGQQTSDGFCADPRHVSRVAMKLHKQINLYLGSSYLSRDHLRMLHGMLGYLAAFEVSISVLSTSTEKDSDEEKGLVSLSQRLSSARTGFIHAIDAYQSTVDKITLVRSTVVTVILAILAISASIYQIYQSAPALGVIGDQFNRTAFVFFAEAGPVGSVILAWVVLLISTGIILNVSLARWVALTSGVGGLPSGLVLYIQKNVLFRIINLFRPRQK